MLDLPPGGSHAFGTGGSEWIVVPLSGACTVEADGAVFRLGGRRDVFSARTDVAYVPRDAELRLTAPGGGRFALAGARCERRLPARRRAAEEVPVELRGAGRCSRQVGNIAAAGDPDFGCDRLQVVEVLTPGGNWSSYPPHKHDEELPGRECVLEEIYFFETAEGPGGRPGFGYHRLSPSPSGRRGTELLAEVRSGDAVLIPDGWHGPSVAAPHHAMYYLNVMAGPGDTRDWLVSDHPEHAWVRQRWPEEPVDPRLPLFPVAPSAEERPR